MTVALIRTDRVAAMRAATAAQAPNQRRRCGLSTSWVSSSGGVRDYGKDESDDSSIAAQWLVFSCRRHPSHF